MVKEIEMTFRFVTQEQREEGRNEQKLAMEHYEAQHECTVNIKSNKAKHYPSPKPGISDYWIETTVLEVYSVLAP